MSNDKSVSLCKLLDTANGLLVDRRNSFKRYRQYQDFVVNLIRSGYEEVEGRFSASLSSQEFVMPSNETTAIEIADQPQFSTALTLAQQGSGNATLQRDHYTGASREGTKSSSSPCNEEGALTSLFRRLFEESSYNERRLRKDILGPQTRQIDDRNTNLRLKYDFGRPGGAYQMLCYETQEGEKQLLLYRNGPELMSDATGLVREGLLCRITRRVQKQPILISEYKEADSFGSSVIYHVCPVTPTFNETYIDLKQTVKGVLITRHKDRAEQYQRICDIDYGDRIKSEEIAEALTEIILPPYQKGLEEQRELHGRFVRMIDKRKEEATTYVRKMTKEAVAKSF